jgi:diaminopimelate epimerase
MRKTELQQLWTVSCGSGMSTSVTLSILHTEKQK